MAKIANRSAKAKIDDRRRGLLLSDLEDREAAALLLVDEALHHLAPREEIVRTFREAKRRGLAPMLWAVVRAFVDLEPNAALRRIAMIIDDGQEGTAIDFDQSNARSGGPVWGRRLFPRHTAAEREGIRRKLANWPALQRELRAPGAMRHAGCRELAAWLRGDEDPEAKAPRGKLERGAAAR